MSHSNVGNTYKTIIEDVIKSSDIDFAESGVEADVLKELRQGWQRKLTQLGIASFPWDPKPEPAPVNNAPPLALEQDIPKPEVNSYTQAQLTPPTKVQALPLPNVHQPVAASVKQNGEPAGAVPIKHEQGVPLPPDAVIKQEPGLQQTNSVSSAAPVFAPAQMRGSHVPLAAQRAAQALEGQFGPRAAASINAIHTGMSQGAQLGQGHGTMPQGMRAGGPANGPMNPQQYRQQVANASALQQQRAAQQAAVNAVPNGIPKSQVDGADDDTFEGVIMRRAADGETTELGRVEIDHMLHDQIAAKAKRMEGGGLMLPLRQATTRGAASGIKRNTEGMAQHDGPDDIADVKREEVDDADAINSDLDDPDDGMDDDEDDDDAMGHIMLCTWDKVQRVKNKWKCTLKDGVLTVNGKEYVFHKATGEYEW